MLLTTGFLPESCRFEEIDHFLGRVNVNDSRYISCHLKIYPVFVCLFLIKKIIEDSNIFRKGQWIHQIKYGDKCE